VSSLDSPFHGTAEYYANFRPGLPPELTLQLIQVASAVGGRMALLDLGTGTGQVAMALHPYFEDVIAVDRDAAMVEVARRELERSIRAGNPVRVLHGRAETVHLPVRWQASLVTIGRAFHWMDQGAVLRHIEPAVRADGVVAIFGEPSLWNGQVDWQQAVKQTIQDFLGEARRAGAGLYQEPVRPFREALETSAFSRVKEVRVPFRRTWTAETILGLLYSTSFSAPQLYGDRVKAFERALQEVLSGFNRKIFVEDSAVELLLARRPSNVRERRATGPQ
jgi:ubiquinone/menaquinone biosynthesis C-methylase UbiE